MGLIWLDSHASYAAGATVPSAAGYSVVGSVANTAASGPNAEACWITPGSVTNEYVRRTHGAAITSGNTFTIGCRYYFAANPAGNVAILMAAEGATVHLAVSITSAGVLQLRRGTTVLASGSTIPTATWFTIELQATIHDTTGTAEVKLNGVSDITYGPGDTRNAGSAGTFSDVFYGNWTSGGGATAAAFRMAFPYITDASGSAYTGYLGTINGVWVPTSGVGAYNDGTFSGAASAWDAVDEVPYDVADYVRFTVQDERATFRCDNVSAGSLAAVMPKAVIQAGASMTAAGCAYRASTFGEGAAVALSTTTTARALPLDTDPSTSAAWTVAGFNAAEFGVRRKDATGGNLTVHQFGIEVFSTGAISVVADSGGHAPFIAPMWVGL